MGRARNAMKPFDRLAIASLGAAGVLRLGHAYLEEQLLVGLADPCASPEFWARRQATFVALEGVSGLGMVAMILAAVSFLLWVRLAVSGAAVHGRRGVVLPSPFEMTAMWCVPLCHAFMPFAYMQSLVHAWDPTDLEPVRVDRDAPPRGYRLPGIERDGEAWPAPWLPLRAFWVTWATTAVAATILWFIPPWNLAGAGLRHAGVIVDVTAALAAFFGAFVVRGVGALAAERDRRIQAARR